MCFFMRDVCFFFHPQCSNESTIRTWPWLLFRYPIRMGDDALHCTRLAYSRHVDMSVCHTRDVEVRVVVH
jgi:hypothetical protein